MKLNTGYISDKMAEKEDRSLKQHQRTVTTNK